jgi:hypothetical protein
MGPADAEAFELSDTEKVSVTEPALTGVPFIEHKTPVVGSEELTEADNPDPLETAHEY